MSDATPHASAPPSSADVQALPENPPPSPLVPARQLGLRLWPGVVIVAVQWFVITLVGWLKPATMAQFMTSFIGPMVGTALVVAWWLFFSRIRWSDRVLVLAVGVASAVATVFASDPSIGFFGLVMSALPLATTAWVGMLVVSQRLSWPIRRAGVLAALIFAFFSMTLQRMDGITGSMKATMSWRWSPTAEDKFLAERAAANAKSVVAVVPVQQDAVKLQRGDWLGFRGPERDGRLSGVQLATDWDKNPPKQLWRQRIGPGWSSFAVVGSRLFTQEQRGEDEMVVCYDADSGKELWAHWDTARFTEVVAGPGPRATPTFDGGKLYVLGAKGKLNCLDAATGKVLWSADIVADSGAKVPVWGFSSSPLICQGVVTVFAGGKAGKSVLGYDAATGKMVWAAGEGELSYCSPQRANLKGIEQVLITTEAGLTAFEPAKGEVLWTHGWPVDNMARIVQPAVLGDSDVLIGSGMGNGTRRVNLGHAGKDWEQRTLWESHAISPYFNDLVVHKGHLYGFDGSFLTCVNLEDGKKKWRARGYGNGQVLLLTDQDLLLVLSEQGEVALVPTNPDAHKELAKFQAIEGKTWNHPVVAHGKLFVRNGEEMACYRLALK